ncbi:protein-methionine-sulfoxide reductase catalytic subunit MsrP [Spongiibacter sp. KMU-158]|uniref:Protein-methionine-sulfoxide reductase catalytic subunit MsrP n=1 Tax=Spongiibacter pelagi TaxID=2760804 RepID=A0A927C1D8_9GAMM|nr:protein-methionine-sulfoxide reductase catalytic subunit MsrP [Spongiibacter pelagi]MBD2858954.1 protein-methionine-sulfoxide reductase catalytic subunit MsrP [Spongiibacter pelagi]
MLIRQKPDIPSSEITSESSYLNRRGFIKASGLGLAAVGLAQRGWSAPGDELSFKPVSPSADNPFYTSEDLTPFQDATHYNNFYEFGTDKTDPARYAGSLSTSPWSIAVEGEVAKPGTYHLEDLLKGVDIEERIYRLRCVEAWSMVIPWLGFPLADLIKRFEPTLNARYIEFETLVRPAEMKGQRSRFSTIDWPYREGLRMDEAMHPLTFLSVGAYGKELLGQNGAPIRLIVPWKYGFKSIKSIVKIRFTDQQPQTSWQGIAPNEYGFYANVNPDVDHPRWSQRYERRLPSSLLKPSRIKTQMFNGYADQVASLYKGMNLRRFY